MVQKFRENFQQCLSTYRQEIASDAFLLSLIGPFYGLTDYSVYEAGSFPAIFDILKHLTSSTVSSTRRRCQRTCNSWLPIYRKRI